MSPVLRDIPIQLNLRLHTHTHSHSHTQRDTKRAHTLYYHDSLNSPPDSLSRCLFKFTQVLKSISAVYLHTEYVCGHIHGHIVRSHIEEAVHSQGLWVNLCGQWMDCSLPRKD